MSENPKRGSQATNFTTNVPKILDLKSSSEHIFSRKLSLGAPEVKARAIIGQRGSLPVTPFGYLNSKKVIFRTMWNMRKQFPGNWLTSGRSSAPKRGGVNK